MDDKPKNPNVNIHGDTGSEGKTTFNRVMKKHDKKKNFDYHRYLLDSSKWFEKLVNKVRRK